MSTWEDERVRQLLAEQEALRGDLHRRELQIERTQDLRRRAEGAARDWRRKLVAISDTYRRRVRQVTDWAARLGEERAAAERERARLADEVERLRIENAELVERLSRIRGDALARFLGSALDSPVDRDRVRRLSSGPERVLSLLGQQPEAGVRTG